MTAPKKQSVRFRCYELLLQPLIHFFRAAQGGLHVVADIFLADYFFEFCLRA